LLSKNNDTKESKPKKKHLIKNINTADQNDIDSDRLGVYKEDNNIDETNCNNNSINHGDMLVIRNLKWDIIFAEDILFILKSFVPENGNILKVEIYPSLFGIKRIEFEKRYGPYSRNIFKKG